MQEAFRNAGEDTDHRRGAPDGERSREGRQSGRSPPAGDQKVRGEGGYVDEHGVPRLNVLELQRYMRSMPKPVIALVAGYAIGGGHVLHVVCDMTIAAENAVFAQTGPLVGTFDGGFWVGVPRSARRAEEGHGRSGTSAGSTRPKRRTRWGW